ncbi:hypothetical protein AACH06_18975 [Ideonella sp. DXS29W]|uniref:Porin n=1 Tax=Ideonella lacteola TaxID=2984193 RepID=A0ABU9BUU8_9BURK
MMVAHVAAVAAGLIVALCGSGRARAHEVEPDAIPDAGVRVALAAAATLADARQPWPSSRLPGVLDTGQGWRDSRGLALEYAVADLAGRVAPALAWQWAMGLHDRDDPHVEAAWLDWRVSDAVYLGAGRNTVPTTPALSQAGHLDRFAAVPLAKRALFDGNWTDDGIVLAWRPAEPAAGWRPSRASVGLWRGQAFPAGGREPESIGDLPITASAGWVLAEAWSLDAFVARMTPIARGRLVQADGAGHTHGSPTCEDTLTGRACFDGRVNLWGGTLAWRPNADWALSATALVRHESGALYSSGGDANYRGRLQGWWADAVWRLDTDWELAARAERLAARHDLRGPGASLVAADAGLQGNRPSSRMSLAATWLGIEGVRWSLEAGDDHVGADENPYVMLRAVWRFSTEWGW